MQKLTRQESLAKATQACKRKKEERLAAELRERGWTVISPYDQVGQGMTEMSTCDGVDLRKHAAA